MTSTDTKNSGNRRSGTGRSGLKRSLLEWGAIAAVIGLLYLTGLHTNVLAAMQRAMLYTGLFNAQQTEVENRDGPFLNDRDYQFTMTTAGGETVTLEDLRGNVIFMNVWASWCPPCIAEMPTIQTLHNRVKDHPGIEIVMLAVDEERQASTGFMERREYSLPVYFPETARPPELRSTYLPTTYVISGSGQIVYKKEGIADYSSERFGRWLMELSEGD